VVFLLGISGDRGIVEELEPLGSYGSQPVYESGPYLQLMVAAVKLARSDLSDPIYSEEARDWLLGVQRCEYGCPEHIDTELFAECLNFGGTFADG
jgi:hypothetical protein